MGGGGVLRISFLRAAALTHLEGIDDNFRDFDGHALLSLLSGGSQVWGDNHIWPAHKRVVSRGWLDSKDVQGCAGHNLVVQSLSQGNVINDAASGHINDSGALLDLAECLCSKQALHTDMETMSWGSNTPWESRGASGDSARRVGGGGGRMLGERMACFMCRSFLLCGAPVCLQKCSYLHRVLAKENVNGEALASLFDSAGSLNIPVVHVIKVLQLAPQFEYIVCHKS